jgi:hypothetical protein
MVRDQIIKSRIQWHLSSGDNDRSKHQLVKNALNKKFNVA